MGSDFAFLARQKHFVLDGKDFYMDLLFYHRGLKRLVLVELMLGEFEPQDKGQVELYLRWLEKNERVEGEESPVALILCAEKSQETANTGFYGGTKSADEILNALKASMEAAFSSGSHITITTNANKTEG